MIYNEWLIEMDIDIKASLSYDEIVDLLVAHVEQNSGYAVKSVKCNTHQGYAGEMGGRSTPSTVDFTFTLQPKDTI